MHTFSNQLTPREEEVFDFIVRHKTDNDGVSPTMREIASNTAVPGTSMAKFYLQKLQEKGLIEPLQDGVQTRNIRVVGARWLFPAPPIPPEEIDIKPRPVPAPKPKDKAAA